MAQVIEPAIDPNQVVPEGDSDFITADDKAALEAEKRGETPEPEKPPPVEPTPAPEPQKEPEPTPEPVETRHDDRPEINRRIERNRKERQEARDRALLEEQLRTLREENLRYKTRAELEDEARKRLDDLKKQSERPDPDTDPYGYRLWSQEQQLQELRQWKENREQQEQQVKQQREATESHQRQEREIIQFLEQDARDFMVEHPDYAEAAAYVRKPFELMLRGTGNNDEVVANVIYYYNLGLGQSSMKNNTSAAEQVYAAAMELGYKPRTATAASVQNGNGAVPPQQQAQTAAQKIERAQKAQSLQGLGGKTPAQRDESEDIAQMNEEALSELSDDDYIRIKQDPRLARILNKKVEGLF